MQREGFSVVYSGDIIQTEFLKSLGGQRYPKPCLKINFWKDGPYAVPSGMKVRVARRFKRLKD